MTSLVFNIGHVEPRFSVQATAAVPPLAAMLGLLVLLRTLHRYVRQAETTAPKPRSTVPAGLDVHLVRAREVFADQLAAGQVPSVRRLKAGLRVGQPRAREVHAYLAAGAVSSS